MSKPMVGLGIMIKNENGQVLLSRRLSEHGLGAWCFPGGHLDFGETMVAGAIRETKEETNLDVTDLELISVADELGALDRDKHYVNIGFLAKSVSGQPKTMEPDKFTAWQWFDLDNLPTPLFEGTALLVARFRSGKIYQ